VIGNSHKHQLADLALGSSFATDPQPGANEAFVPLQALSGNHARARKPEADNGLAEARGPNPAFSSPTSSPTPNCSPHPSSNRLASLPKMPVPVPTSKCRTDAITAAPSA
jgi:hypothetical protein